VEILDPTADPVELHRRTLDLAAPAENVIAGNVLAGNVIAGKVVGLRLDRAWRSYMVVVDEWEKLLRRDGAEPLVLWTGERIGDEGETTRADLEEWSRRIDCGVVGLGN
jgi:hypothetical protein